MNKNMKALFNSSPVTFFLIMVMMLIYVYEVIVNIQFIPNAQIISQINAKVLLSLGAIIQGSQIIEPVNYIKTSLLHGSIIHYTLNMLFFVQFGVIFESALGQRRYILGILTIMLGSGLLISFWPTVQPTVVVGFSGVLFGLFGILIGLGVHLNEFKTFKNMYVPYVLVLFLTSMFIPQVSNIGHLSGFIVGLTYGYIEGVMHKGKR